MADVAQLPGVFEQIRLVAGVRWLILKHGLRRKNNVWDLIGMIWLGIVSTAAVIGLSFAFYFGGYEFLKTERAAWLSLLFWGIFLWWQVFPIFVAGFGSNFEFATLLRFPLSQRAFYLLGLGYGLSDFAAISSICWIVCMLAGAMTVRLTVFPSMALVCLLFVLINLTLERLVGSWLEKLLSKRRSREIFLAVFVMCMVSLNFLNPILQRWGHSSNKPKLLHLIPYFNWLPGSLAGNAVAASVLSNFRSFAIEIGGLLAWAVDDQRVPVATIRGAVWRRNDQRKRRAGGGKEADGKRDCWGGAARIAFAAGGGGGVERISLYDAQRFRVFTTADTTGHGGGFLLPVRAGIDVEGAFGEALAVFSRNHGLPDLDYADARLQFVCVRGQRYSDVFYGAGAISGCVAGKESVCAGTGGI